MNHLHCEKLFSDLGNVPFSSLPSLLENMKLMKIFPSNSVLLVTQARKDIFYINEPRLLVITGHLYLDYILEKILDTVDNNLNNYQRESFYAKLKFLNDAGKFNIDIYNTLAAINSLRNKFAHNIFYDITQWNPTLIPYVQKYGLKVPKKRNLLKAFLILVIQVTLLTVIETIEKQYSWLMFEYIPNTPTSKRSSMNEEIAQKLKQI